jgi:WD40 repeat protein
MRLLRRHYGKLAAALLLGLALYGLWWAQPVQPRVILATAERYVNEFGTSRLPVVMGFTSDGDTLITRTSCFESPTNHGGPVRSWNTKTGQQRLQLASDWPILGAIAVSPDGRFLAASNGRNILRIWETTRGMEVATIKGPDQPDFYQFLEFSPDSTILAGRCEDERVRLWAQPNWEERASFLCSQDPTLEDGMLSGLRNSYGPSTALTCQEQLDDEDYRYRRFRFSPDGRWLALAATDKATEFVQIVQLATYTISTKLPATSSSSNVPRALPPFCRRVLFTPDSRAAIVAGSTGVVIWDMTEARKVATIAMGDQSDTNWSFCCDGRLLAVCQSLGLTSPWIRCVLWDITVAPPRQLSSFAADEAVLSADGHTLALLVRDSARAEYMVRLVDLLSQRESLVARTNQHKCHIEFSPDGCTLALRVFERSEKPGIIQEIGEWLRRLTGQSTTTVSDHMTVRLWDVKSQRRIVSLERSSPLAFSPDGQTLVTMGETGAIEIWDIPPRKPLGWFLGLAGLLLMLTLGGFWWQARRRKQKAVLATEAIPCGT